MTREELFARATDPRQYDGQELDWPREGMLASPSMQFFHHYLGLELGDLSGRSVIDIGCGTGHLFTLFDGRGARRVVGIEPASRSAELARQHHPRLEVVESTLIEARLDSRFDVAVAVMSFEHQADLPAAFRRVADLLAPGGTFFLVTADSKFHVTPRFGLGLEIHELPDGSVLVATGYPYGTIHDVVRPAEHYARAGRGAGLALVREVGLVPTPELIDAVPQWREFAGQPINHLMVFRS